MPDHDLERRLTQRLRAYEARIPDEEAPEPSRVRARRRFPWPLAAGAAAMALVAGGLAAVMFVDLPSPPVGDASSLPAASESATPSPSPTATSTAEESPLASATLSPSATPTPAPPIPSLQARDGWSVSSLPNSGRGLVGMSVVRDLLVAHGGSAGPRAGIWITEDGSTWSEVTAIPDPPAEMGAVIWDLVDAGERLVAVASLGLAEGSGYYDAAVYVSVDGRSWSEVTEAPTSEPATLFAVERIGPDLVAVGYEGAWRSTDGGLTWAASPANRTLDGQMVDLTVSGDTLWAVGHAGHVYGVEGPLAWRSTDHGVTWERIMLGAAGSATAVTVDADGAVLVGGHLANDGIIWRSADGGVNWGSSTVGSCCIEDLVTTPTGLVLAARDGVQASTDGITWNARAAVSDGEHRAGVFSPRHGLAIAVVEPPRVALGPHPYP